MKDGAISSYEDLTLKKWKDKICTRSGYHPYNVDLISSMIIHRGLDATRGWLEGIKNNLARRPQGNDRAQIKAIKEGICDISLGNSYYFGQMYFNEEEPEQKEWAASVKLIFPNQGNRGTHVNISGMALAKHAPNKKEAIQLMNFLVSDEAQFLYASKNYEFPINKNVEYSDFLKEYMSGFKWDTVSIEKIGQLRKESAKLLDKIRFDQ